MKTFKELDRDGSGGVDKKEMIAHLKIQMGIPPESATPAQWVPLQGRNKDFEEKNTNIFLKIVR